MRIRALLLALAAFVCLPGAPRAQNFGGVDAPYTLQGIVAKDQATAQTLGWFAISIGVVGSDAAPRWVGATAFKTWNDDPFVGRGVLRKLMPSTPNLLFVGPAELVSQFTSAPVGSRMTARGVLNMASRNFMLSGIQITAPGKGK